MHAMQDSPLLATPAALGRAAVIEEHRTWSWIEVHAQAIAFATLLEAGATVCNLCNSRLAFLVTWLAALRRGCIQVLPPSTGPTDLRAMLQASHAPIVIVDDTDSETRWSAEGRCIRFNPSTPASTSVQVWSPDWDAPSVRLYTSGSTGTPEAQVKTLRQLARGAQVLAARIDQDVPGGVAGLGQIVCSVAPQHMFGLETSVMLPLVTGTPAREGKPLLPGDVSATFDRIASHAAWIATPLHLRAFAQSGMTLANARMLLVSTMPLSQSLAVQAESFSCAPVLEIYGSTETGVLAMRRTACESRWRPVEDVQIEPQEEGTTVHGSHFASPRTLADQVELHADDTFALLGRRGDIIKIAGRRASLANLNLCLQNFPGLGDGVLHLPAAGSDTQRVVLIHAGPSLDRTEVRRWLRERMDPVFVPREIIQVDKLPRTSSGKLVRASLEEICTAHRRKREA
jgi:acyl-coenzyme A synthetase/AMP-(fatty) acid ligase